MFFNVLKENEMKNAPGIIKEIDKLGRIVIPKEFRERLNFENNVEIVLTENGILIRNPEYVLVRNPSTNK